jgi:hypothetical protein
VFEESFPVPHRRIQSFIESQYSVALCHKVQLSTGGMNSVE